MNNKILKSSREKKRSRLISFFMSVFITGFGQIYNGKLQSGLALISIRAVTLMIIPIYLQIKPDGDNPSAFLSTLIFNLILTIYSPLEALHSSIRQGVIILKKFNSPAFYIFFSIINIALTSISLFVVMNIFEIKKISGSPNSIIFKERDYLLILKFKKEGFRRGELVAYRGKESNKIGRIIGMPGDIVKQEKYTFSVNDVPLGVGTFDELEMAGFPLGDYGKILSESWENIKYPIKTDIEKDIHGKSVFRIRLKESEVIVADDNREAAVFYEIIRTGSITGRIEGIIFSDDLKRLLMKPHLPLSY